MKYDWLCHLATFFHTKIIIKVAKLVLCVCIIIIFVYYRITNKQGPCYLDSPIMPHIKNIKEYQNMTINVVVDHGSSKLKHPIKMTCEGLCIQ